MNYLFRYLTTLKPDDVERIAGMETTVRERELLDVLLRMRATPGATKQQAMEELGMSGSMFDKSCSTLLSRLLTLLAPAGDIELLEHLLLRGVHDLFLHRFRALQKGSAERGDREASLRFHRDAFLLLHLRFSSSYPERLARQIGAAWRKLDPSNDTEIIVEAGLLGMAVWTEAARRTGDETERKLERRLRRNDARITEATGPFARYRQLKAWIAWYGQLGADPERRMECLQASLELCRRHPDVLPIEEKVRTLCQIAEEHYFYRTDHRIALEMYRDIFRSYPEQLRHEDYHRFKMIQLCLIVGELEEAEQILSGHFGMRANMEVHAGGRAKGVALLWTKLSLLAGRLEDARRHLDDAIELNQKGFYLQMEIECRMLHTALCYLEGDFDLLERRIPAHLKFLRSKGITLTASRYYPWFFKLVGAFVDRRTLGTTIEPRFRQKLDEFMEGAAAQYGVLLRKMEGGDPGAGIQELGIWSQGPMLRNV